jgi:large subunit ribosomal protein L35
MFVLRLVAMQAAAKRFKVTGGGKIMARHAGKQHFNEKMTRDAIR